MLYPGRQQIILEYYFKKKIAQYIDNNCNFFLLIKTKKLINNKMCMRPYVTNKRFNVNKGL